MISGHVLYKKGQKISKSKGNSKSGPEQLIEQYSADVIRYWTAGAKLGSDCYFEENEFKIAAKLVTKIFNASKFALMHLENFDKFDESKITIAIDQAMISRLNKTAARADKYLSQYEYSLALSEIEGFFWDFCDNYMELIKHRIYNPQEHGEGAGESVQNTLYAIVYGVIRMLAPFIPHITEEIYQAYFKQREGHVSLHLADYPNGENYSSNDEAEKVYEEACQFVAVVRKFKTEQRLSLNTELSEIDYLHTQFKLFKEAQKDIERAARCENIKAIDSLNGRGSLVEFEGKQLQIGKPIEEES